MPDDGPQHSGGMTGSLKAARAGVVLVVFIVAVAILVAVGTRSSPTNRSSAQTTSTTATAASGSTTTTAAGAAASSTTTPTTARHGHGTTTTASTVPHASVSVVVANATSANGLAAHYSTVIGAGGWKMGTPIDASTTQATSTVYYAAGQQAAAQEIANTIGVKPTQVQPLTTAAPTRTALFLDFDGTLSAIVADPRDARPLPGVPALLSGLAEAFELVAVISGRPTSFLYETLGSPAGVTLAGLYGLERALQGPAHDAWAGVIDDIVRQAEATAPPGIYVEPKGLTVTLHWRHAPTQKEWVLDFARRAAASHNLVIHQGRHERELRPPLQVDKGTVVRSLAAEQTGRLDNAAAFGDDIGDLPAFEALGELTKPDGTSLYTVRVAAVDTESPRQVADAADLTVAGANGAVALLAALKEAAHGAGSASAAAQP